MNHALYCDLSDKNITTPEKCCCGVSNKLNNMEKRMYFFVPYNLSEIQKGIQAGHAALRYAVQFPEESKDFVDNHETWIILNGGTTNRTMGLDNVYKGSLDDIKHQIWEQNQLLGKEDQINYSYFHEPDLNDALSAVCFIADERVFNKEDYPDWESIENHMIGNPEPGDDFEEAYDDWLKNIGGKKNEFLRKLLKGKKFA